MEPPDKFPMGAVIQSESDPAGQLLTGRNDPKGPEALADPPVTSPGDDVSVPSMEPRGASPRSLGLRKFIGLPGWHSRKLAAARAQLADAEARRAKLEQDLTARVGTVRREADTAHAAQVAALEAQTAARIKAVRRDAETALAILATELKTQAAKDIASAVHEAQDEAVRVAAETAEKHDAALTATQAELGDAEAQHLKLEEDLATQVASVRREAESALAAQMAASEAQAAAEVEAAVREARASARRSAAKTAGEHDAALAAARAQVDDAEVRRVKLKEDLTAQLDTARRRAETAHTAHVSALEAEAAGQVGAARRAAEAALAAQETDLKEAAATQVAVAVRAAQAEAAQLLAATAEQQEIALKGIRGQLTHEGERRVKLEEDFALQLETVRTEADTKHQAKVAELEVEAAERLDATRRDAETALEILATELKAQAAKQTQSAVDEAARAADGTAQQHEAAVGDLQAEAVRQTEAAVRAAQTDAAQMLVATMKEHDVALATVRTQLVETERRCAKLEQDLVVQVETVRREAKEEHVTRVAALKAQAVEEVEEARHAAEAALRARETELAAQAAAQTEAAVRKVRVEAAATIASTQEQHDMALAALLTQLADAEAGRVKVDQDLAFQVETVRREAAQERAAKVAALEVHAAAQVAAAQGDATSELAVQKTELEERAVVQVEAAVREAQADAAEVLSVTKRQNDVALAALQARLADTEARQLKLEEDHAVQVVKVIRESDAKHADQVATLKAQAAGQLETVGRDAATVLEVRERELANQAVAQAEAAVSETRESLERAAGGGGGTRCRDRSGPCRARRGWNRAREA